MIRTLPCALACFALVGCSGVIEGTSGYRGADSVIATNVDKGGDSGALTSSHPAVAYTPDGCQVWIIDDGVEGYASNRFNPRTGRPVCNNRFPPGSVIGNYETDDPGVRDSISGPSGVATIIPNE